MERIDEFRNALSVHISELNIKPMVNSVSQHPEEFPDIYKLTSDSKLSVSWRALWVCEKLSEVHPGWFIPLYDELIGRLLNCTHDGSKRLYLSILFNLPVKEPVSVPLLNFCFDRMFSPAESIGVQALCIKMAYRLCEKEPELMGELRIILESAETEFFTKGVATAIRNTLKKMKSSHQPSPWENEL
ncbi:hypothetical protein [Bacteroides sp.]